MKLWILSLVTATVATPFTAAATDLLTVANTPTNSPIKASAEKLDRFSPELAARYLDIASLNWQKDRNCVTCHTNMAYLMARPALESASRSSGEVRNFFQDYINERWKEDERKPKSGDYRTVVVATGLVFNDIQTKGVVSEVTEQALSFMWDTQRADGGWTWAKCGWAPMEIDDHYGVSLAVLSAGIAATYDTEKQVASKGMPQAIDYLKNHSAPSLHHRIMLAWASRYSDGILDHNQQMAIVKEVLSSQLADGGWSTAKMLADWPEFKRKDKTPPRLNASDGYATGLALVLLREFGIAPTQPPITRGIDWIKGNQDSDGKWFSPSPSKDSKQFFTNIGTAFTILGLQAYGEIPGWPFQLKTSD